MRVPIAATLLVAVLIPAVPITAQPVSSGTSDLQTEITRKRHIVRPAIDPAAVMRDADEATIGRLPQVTSDAIARGLNEALIRRPDMDYDVISGIQQQNIRRSVTPPKAR